ncbi:MAG: hypothetical protein ACOC2L_03210 [Candidatus Sumerlaeota bacterium]
MQIHRKTTCRPTRLFGMVFCLLLATSSMADEKQTFTPLEDAESVKVLAQVYERLANMHGIAVENAITAYTLDNPTLEHIVRESFATQYPPKRQHAMEVLLKSLEIIPRDMDILEMYLSLLSEQVGGLYDPHSRRFFVRESYNVAESSMARAILAHEIIHSLQDQVYDLVAMGVESSTNDDKALAVLAIAEGDAMHGMSEYTARFEASGILGDLPEALSMDQSALRSTPHFFQQMLIWPYIDGQVFIQRAMKTGDDWRDRIFTDPPRTTEQIMHPEKYFGERDHPTTVSLLTEKESVLEELKKLGDIDMPENLAEKYDLHEKNRFGEIGTRLILETHLGTGIATVAAAGWDGDAYAIYKMPQSDHSAEHARWAIVWETVWDSPGDASEFVGAWVTVWRSITGERSLGSLSKEKQTFKAGDWHVTVHRDVQRVVTYWQNSSHNSAAATLDN